MIFLKDAANLIKKGANVIFVILNEGWYRNLKTARHFNYFSVLRAIENRKSVVRSSNDGITSIINERGDLLQSLEKFEPSYLKAEVSLNNTITFYTKNGDYLGKIAIFLLGSLIIFRLAWSKINKRYEISY